MSDRKGSFSPIYTVLLTRKGYLVVSYGILQKVEHIWIHIDTMIMTTIVIIIIIVAIIAIMMFFQRALQCTAAITRDSETPGW